MSCNELVKIYNEFDIFIENPTMVYKSCQQNYIIILQKLDDTITNESRNFPICGNKLCAKYRGNKFKVIEIFHKFTLERILEIKSPTYYNDKTWKCENIIYKKDQTIKVNNYDKDNNVICGRGIHYFKKIDVSFYYQLFLIDNGLYFTWHDNGNIKYIYSYENQKQTGESLEYYENTIQSKKCNYVDGVLNEDFVEWYENGNIWRKCNYVDGKRIGLYEQWLSNGKIYVKVNYDLDNLDNLDNLIVNDLKSEYKTSTMDNTQLKNLIITIIVIMILCYSIKIIYEHVKNST